MEAKVGDKFKIIAKPKRIGLSVDFDIGDIVVLKELSGDANHIYDIFCKGDNIMRQQYIEDEVLEKITEETFIEQLDKKDLLCFVWDEYEKHKTIALVEAYCPESITPYWTRDFAYKNAKPLTLEEAKEFIYAG